MAGALLKYNGQALQTPSGAYGINNLVPENVKSGVNIGGVVGNYSGKNIYHEERQSSFSQYNITFQNVTFEPSRIVILCRTTNNYNSTLRYLNANVKNKTGVISNMNDVAQSISNMTFAYDSVAKTFKINLTTTSKLYYSTYDIFLI